MDSTLKTFWIKSPLRHAPLGFGVTAYSLDEAIQILHALGWDHYLPKDSAELSISEGIRVESLDSFVRTHMGSVATRGVWYPLNGIGVPKWIEERL